MDERESGSGIDRREVLKRAAVIGGVVWSAPVLQSVTRAAFAQTGSIPSAGCTTFYAVKFDQAGNCVELPVKNPNAKGQCITRDPQAVNGGCDHVESFAGEETPEFVQTQVTLEPGCQFTNGMVKCGPHCCPDLSNTDCIPSSVVFAGNVATFQCRPIAGGGTGLSHAEAWFCCP